MSRMVKKGGEVLRSESLNVVGGDVDLCTYEGLSMATISYEAPHGRFNTHIDHCNGSYVFLASLGNTCNFMVHTPSMASPRRFKLFSGDMLVFNPSTEAAIKHGVESIDEAASSSGESLGREFPALKKHRYGVQCRMHFPRGSLG